MDRSSRPITALPGAVGVMVEERQASLRRKLEELRVEHRDLDDAIARLSEGPFVDQIQLRRMKKRKLQLKDFIAVLESELIPDLDA